MELFEKIRREYEHGIGTIIGVANEYGVHRRMIRQALASSVPPDRQVAVRDKPKLSLVMDFVNEILEADKSVRRKQRHTAHKIWDRIMKEKNISICESVVRAFVRKRKQEMGMKGQGVTIPQITTIQFFCMRSMYSGGAFHIPLGRRRKWTGSRQM